MTPVSVAARNKYLGNPSLLPLAGFWVASLVSFQVGQMGPVLERQVRE
jgi:hypothetical protein